MLIKCHTLRGCVDWNSTNTELLKQIDGHTLRGCVDWNNLVVRTILTKWRHTLRGCVDWNLMQLVYELYSYVTPYVGVWIETSPQASIPSTPASHPTWVCGLKPLDMVITLSLFCHTLRGCVDWNTCFLYSQRITHVTPYVGVWIETPMGLIVIVDSIVTPYVGVWIETNKQNFS